MRAARRQVYLIGAKFVLHDSRGLTGLRLAGLRRDTNLRQTFEGFGIEHQAALALVNGVLGAVVLALALGVASALAGLGVSWDSNGSRRHAVAALSSTPNVASPNTAVR